MTQPENAQTLEQRIQRAGRCRCSADLASWAGPYVFPGIPDEFTVIKTGVR